MAGTEVILLRSTDTGAPTLSGQAGKLLDVLDACLVDGYNSKTVQSITRSGQTATVTYATAHGYAADGITKVEISGATQSEYNGVFVISNVTTTSFDITVTGSPVTPATGTIISKVPPLGWGRPFTRANNICAYRSAEYTGTKLYLRVVDDGSSTNGARNARLCGYEQMGDVNTGSGLFPTNTQLSGGLWLAKSFTLDSAPRKWILVGDGFEFFLFYCHQYSSASYDNIYRIFHFGDPASEQSSDPFGCLIFGEASEVSQSQPESGTSQGHGLIASSTPISTTMAGHYWARNYTQIGSAVLCCKFSIGMAVCAMSVFGRTFSTPIPYPSSNNNGIYIAPIAVNDSGATNIIRAMLKGIYTPLHNAPLGHGATYDSPTGLSGRKMYTIATPYSSTTPGEAHLDITGPWR